MKVLFIAYDFPPCTAIGGALRSAKFVKYLPEFGWDPYVIAHEETKSNYTKNNSGVVRLKSLTPYSKPYEITPYGWALSLYRYGRKLSQAYNFDLIYVSCPPFPQTLSALSLKKLFKCPLVIDFRDAWSLDPYTEGSKLKKNLYRKIFPTIENKVLQETDLLITNTPSMQKAYIGTYPFLKNRTVLIPNGFDEDDFKNLVPVQNKNSIFTLLYSGRFGIGARDPGLLFRAIKKFISKKGKVLQLKIVGDESDLLKQHVNQFGFHDVVTLTGTMPHQEAISQMHYCDVLVLYQENTNKVISAVAGKTYEYLRAGRPILAVAPPGDNLDLIKEYSRIYECSTDYNEDTLVSALERQYENWEESALPIVSTPPKNYMENYNRQELSKKLAFAFNALLEK